jgi:tetratricopeptide (TPR) repeat protein
MTDSSSQRSWGETRRALLTRVLVVYLGVSFAVLETVDIFSDQIGLPHWFFLGTVYLLIIGLPIVVITGLVHFAHRNGGADPGADEGDAESGAYGEQERIPARRHWLTWQRAVLGGFAVLAIWGLVVTVYMTTRALGVGPVGSLVAAGVIDEREQIILADFQDNSGDPLLGRAATEAFRIDLSQSTIVTVVEPGRVDQALALMQKDPEVALGEDLAREVAIREGIKAVVAGEITPVGTGYVLAARLVSAEDGRVLAASRETARDSTALISAIDRLSKKLRERIGESIKTIRAADPLDHVTTPSLAALRKYSQAVSVIEQGDNERGISLLEEAVALDTAFAMAWRKLGVTLSNIGRDRERVIEAVTKAYEHRDRLTDRERYLTLGTYYADVTGENDRAIAAYQTLLDGNPSDTWALNNLGLLYLETRDFRLAEQLLVRAIEVDSMGALYFSNALTALVAQGKVDEAERILADFARRVPGHPTVATSEVALAGARFDYERGERVTREFGEANRSSAFWSIYTSFNLATLSEVRGRLADAERYLTEAIAAAEDQGDLALVVGAHVRLAFYDLMFRGEAARAVERVEATLQRHPLETMSLLERPYLTLATFYALAERPERARAYLNEAERATEADRGRDSEGDVEATAGLVALAEGNLPRAIEQIRAADEGACSICTLPFLGHAYDEAGQPDSVVAIYERYVNTPWLYRLGSSDWFALANVYERLAGLYEMRGDTEQALIYYNRFVELWKDADPELQPRVEAARRAVERLSAET